MTVTRGMRCCGAVSTPADRRVASRAASTSVAGSASCCPGTTWEPRRRMWSRAGNVWIVTVAGSGPGPGETSVFSTGTTMPSKPVGTAAPVMMRTAVPGRGVRAGEPAGTSPMTFSVQGPSSGGVRKPSIAELSPGGIAMRAETGSASTRPADTGAMSAATGRRIPLRRSKYSWILKGAGVIAPNLAANGGHRAIRLQEALIVDTVAR